jgi:lysine-N-methylase
MASTIRNLPVVQNWDCHSCSHCCRDYQVPVFFEEQQRIAQQGWEKDAELGGVSLIQGSGPPWARRYVLAQRDNHCIFLTDQNRCRIHERHGANAKPLACRLFPFVLVPTDDHWRVSLRFACPSAARNQGKPLSEHSAELTRFAAELDSEATPQGSGGARTRVPRLQLGQRVDWSELFRFADALQRLLETPSVPVQVRLRRCLALARICRQARFDRITGSRLGEFLDIVCAGLDSDVPLDSTTVPPPTWVGRVLFRQMAALYSRRDHGSERGPDMRNRLALLQAALRFARGVGRVPALHSAWPSVTFEQLDEPRGPLPEDAAAALARYYVVKVASMQFCGPTNFGMGFWQGFESLAATYPVIMWWARALAQRPDCAAITRAIEVVDYHFGFNPILGTWRQRFSLGILAERGELDRLIAWYSQ